MAPMACCSDGTKVRKGDGSGEDFCGSMRELYEKSSLSDDGFQ
jgi:hypothetical protein